MRKVIVPFVHRGTIHVAENDNVWEGADGALAVFTICGLRVGAVDFAHVAVGDQPCKRCLRKHPHLFDGSREEG